jgi:poly(A) polymerase
MLRAVRFACKLGFIIDPACEAPLPEMAPLLAEVPPARLFEEILKLFHSRLCAECLREAAPLRPVRAACFPRPTRLARQDHDFPITFVSRGLEQYRPAHPRRQARRAAVPVRGADVGAGAHALPSLARPGRGRAEAMASASHEVASRQQRHVAIPKRFGLPMREIWLLQPRLEHDKASDRWH